MQMTRVSHKYVINTHIITIITIIGIRYHGFGERDRAIDLFVTSVHAAMTNTKKYEYDNYYIYMTIS